MHPVEKYLNTLSEIHRTGGGTSEESYYGALENLLNEVGAKLKPRVRAVAQLKNTGAGEPDFGLYTANQFQRAKDGLLISGPPPERGVVEAKGLDDNISWTAEGDQVKRYANRYGLVLVTNYREFVLVRRDETGQPVPLEFHGMSSNRAAFLALLANPAKAAADHGDRLDEFLRRVLLYEAALTNPEDLAWFLASYAREARYRIEAAADLPALDALKKGLQEALGMTFEGEKGEHFFRATLVQTLFYGIFSSWVLWSRDHWGQPDARFNWHDAAWIHHVPMIASLFDQIATRQRLKPLGVDEVLDWAGAALNRVDRPAFFAKFEEERAVQYFYEPFLEAYDPELRKELGVWYTPPEIVQYQVERVDRAVREELGLPDGLADENVVILDPCCGTGAYLVETLARIYRTLEVKQHDSALTAQRLKKAAMNRVFGFDILPAPFVIAHLQLGLMLRRLGAPLDPDSDQRVGVYLTNALTGWEPPQKPKDALLPYPEFQEERDAANQVKNTEPILVIIGNPPYNAFAGVSPKEQAGLVDDYKKDLTTPVNQGGWGIKKFNLDDLYVRFFRIAERRIAKSGKGVVSYISNFSYLGDPSFVVMRQRFLAEFDKLWFDCMNGDSRETGKLTPEGKPDPSVFSTGQKPVGIRVGTAICVMVRNPERSPTPTVLFRNYWGVTKRQDLLASLSLKQLDRKYQKAKPAPGNRFSFKPSHVSPEYSRWPSLVELGKTPPSNGLMEKRGGALIDLNRSSLEERMRDYFDPKLGWEEYKMLHQDLTSRRARFQPKETRKKIIAAQKADSVHAEKYDPRRVVRYALRPFDHRWAYYTPIRPVWNEPRPALWAQCWEGNEFLVTRPARVASPEGAIMYFSTVLGDNDLQRGHSYYFPLRVRQANGHKFKSNNGVLPGLEDDGHIIRANLSDQAREYLASMCMKKPDQDEGQSSLIWLHALAVGYSPLYLSENADGIRQDWPRIPLPVSRDSLEASAELGRRVAALLDAESPFDGVTRGKLAPRLKVLGVIRKAGGGPLNPDAGELDLTAGWGHRGKGGVCQPGKGKVEVRSQKDEESDRAFGGEALDVYLNGAAYWSNIPRAVWDYTIGGYQVIKKWLSYREKSILGRGLTLDEADYVTQMVRRIAALILLQPDLDNNYKAAKSDTWPWPGEN